jgi:membrane protein DedA with SNARE-associated domain
MSSLEWTGSLAYLAVFVATVVEGEVVFIAAAVLASSGQLEPVGVLLAAALGGSAGDQAYFYVVRSLVDGRLDRLPARASRGDRIRRSFARRVSAMIFTCRFLPGLRSAIPVACALTEVSGLRFSVLSLVSSLAWAAGIVGIVSWIGPAVLARFGVGGGWTALGPALVVLAISWVLTHRARNWIGA